MNCLNGSALRILPLRSAESDTTLLIIDMQTGFPASSRIIGSVLQEIDFAISNGWSIVVVEVGVMRLNELKYGETHAVIMDKVRASGLPWIRLRKDGNNAVEQVKQALEGSRFGRKVIRVCGVNLHVCIDESVISSSEAFPESIIAVVQGACDDKYGMNWERFLKPKRSNVRLAQVGEQLSEEN